MTVGEVAGLIAAIVFAILVGISAVPIIKLGRVFDSTRDSIKEITDHTVPVIDETAQTVSLTNVQLERVDTITTHAADVTENVSALTALFSATVGSPLVKVAAFTYGVRQAFSRRKGK